MKFKWTIEISIAPMWVADGVDLTDDSMHSLMMRALPYLRGDEIGVKVIKRPDDASVATEQGYPSVGAYLAARKARK